MKKSIFYIILILILTASCTPDYDEATYTQAAALPDPAPVQTTSSVTVYLDGYEPVGSRAMNLPFAIMSCDYFEVVFIGKNSAGTVTTVKGQWRSGEKAVVSGVYRTAAGVPYDNVDPSASLAINTGSALLLAGKSDKTIMAIGKLPTGTVIDNNTKSVTFEVAAVKTGVTATADSSFLTAAGGSPTSNPLNATFPNTIIENEEIKTVNFLAFRLECANPDIRAKYIFRLHSGDFSDYTDGLLVAAPGIVEKKHPSYTMYGNGNIDNSFIIVNEKTNVTMTNNQLAGVGSPFQPEVTFKFDTTGTTAGSLFALVFEIPVYALVPECGWYIRPGYGVLQYELDEGRNGPGGAVLIKTGQASVPVISDEFKIKILTVPQKWRYRWATAPSETSDRTPFTGTQEFDRTFSYTGLVVELENMDGSIKTDNPAVPTGIIPNDLLDIIIGRTVLPKPVNTYQLPSEFYGLIEVTVVYADPRSDLSAEDKFYIIASSTHPSTSGFDYANLTTMTANISSVIMTANDFNTLFNAVNGGPANHITIVRLGASFNIPQITIGTSSLVFNPDLPGFSSRLIMFVATASNVVLGRGATERINVNGDNAGLVAFYFGRWPFDGLPYCPTLLNTAVIDDNPNNDATRDFTVNAGGTITDPYAYVTKMIIDSTTSALVPGGGIYNVDLGKGVTVNPPNLLH